MSSTKRKKEKRGTRLRIVIAGVLYLSCIGMVIEAMFTMMQEGVGTYLGFYVIGIIMLMMIAGFVIGPVLKKAIDEAKKAEVTR